MASEMKWIGLTGGIASGKSTVASIIKKMGVPVVDADSLARLAVQKGSMGLGEVERAFGPGILSADGELDRKKLGQFVFSRPADLEKLEKILHPIIRNLAEKERDRLRKENHKLAVYDVPLLFEKKMEPLFDGILVVSTTRESQEMRMKSRDGLSPSDVKSRLSSQIPLSEKVKKANWVIENSGSIVDLEKKVKDWYQQVL